MLLLEPHRFITRQSEVTKERPGKEPILDEASRFPKQSQGQAAPGEVHRSE